MALNAEPNITITAASILHTLINGIVLHPRKKRDMEIEVYSDPSALFVVPTERTIEGTELDDNGGSGGANPP